MHQNQKRIVIIEGDAFDADAIVAIVRVLNGNAFRVVLPTDTDTSKYTATCSDAKARDAAMDLAIEAWRSVVGYLPVVEPLPLPDQPPVPPNTGEPNARLLYWADEHGRFIETYGGQTIYIDTTTVERFIWNEGPPRRKNPLGPGASKIVKIYVGGDGKPLDVQPI